MKRKFISKIMAGTLISTSLSTLIPIGASAEWQTINDKTYYFDDNGKMKIGWIQLEDSWYFLESNGVLKTGWIKYNGNWYYADSSGVMQTGIIGVGGSKYILDTNGVMKTINTFINGHFYTIGDNGAVVGNTTLTADKEFDSFGKCIKSSKNSDSDSNSTSTTTSPTSSKLYDTIEDQSEVNAESEEYYGVKYTITYEDTDGSFLKSSTVKKGKKVELYTPTKDGYQFSSWNAKSDGSGKSYDAGDDIKINRNLTLFAQWTKIIYVTSISISGSSSVTVGNTIQMTAKALPSTATNSTVTWSVTNGTGSATIDSSGVVTGVSAGKVTVTATATDDSGVSATKEVTVSAS